ncbi:MAG: ParB/RepB/Spo0J family partition protein [Phycisphaerales bacterium]|nr:ParB/RepB/Spo0J family partition protein [Phycisphaerales bacterium]
MSKQPTASRLGRGLSTIIAARKPADPAPAVTSQKLPISDGLSHVPVGAITPNPRQPRAIFDQTALSEMASSIRQSGVIQPLIVRAVGAGRYELVAGERRWRAAKEAGLANVPCLIRDISDVESLEIALIENLQREDLGPLERATAYQGYLDSFGGTVEALATKLGESRANVANYIRLLRLEPEIRELVASGELQMGQARAIAGVTEAHRRLALARMAARQRLSVRQVEELAGAQRDDQREAKSVEKGPVGDTNLRAVEEAFQKALGVKVRISGGRRRNAGRIQVFYNSLEEFEAIAERLGINPRLE